MDPKEAFLRYDSNIEDRVKNMSEEIFEEYQRRAKQNLKFKSKFLELNSFSYLHLGLELANTPIQDIKKEVNKVIKTRQEAFFQLEDLAFGYKQESIAIVKQRFCRSNFYELSSYIGSLKSEEDKKQFYQRFLNQVEVLQSTTNLFQEDKDIKSFIRNKDIPTELEERKRFERVVRKIKNAGFLQDKVASRIQKYLTSPLQKEMLLEEKPRVTNSAALEIKRRYSLEENSRTKEDSRTKEENRVKEESKVEEVQKNKLNRENPAEVLEYLTDLFELRPKVARKYVSDISLTDLVDLHDKLGTRVESAYIAGLIQINPEILRYKQTGDLSTYLKLLKQVQTRISLDSDKESELKEEFGIENNLKAYSNLEELMELKEELYSRTKTEVETEDAQTHRGKLFAKYTLLHRSDSLVEERLTNLIDKGEITVEEHEYWNSKHSGARSFHVVKKIIFQMMGLFNDLELGEPDYNIVRGQRKLILEPETREQLRRARDEAYSLQR